MRSHKKNSDTFLDEVLSTSPGFTMPEDFAGKMALKFEKHFAWKQYFREFIIFLSIGLGSIAIAIAMLFFLMADIWQKWFAEFLKNPVVWIGLLFVLTFILFTDKVLLKYFSYRMKLHSARA